MVGTIVVYIFDSLNISSWARLHSFSESKEYFDLERRIFLYLSTKILVSMKRVIVLSGSGISAESGLSTFRDAGGLWEGH